MKKRSALGVSAILLLLIVGAAAAYTFRGSLRDLMYQASQPALPPAKDFQEPTKAPVKTTPTPTKPAPKPTPTPTPTPTPSPTPVAPNATTTSEEINLAVPFLLQAPKQDWSQPFEDACEEASMIMVDAYYDHRKSDYGADEGTKAILDVVAYEDKTYGYNKDTTTQDVAYTLMNFFKRPRVSIQPSSEENIKAALRAGYPVIVPAYGKALLNPNFRNGGPEYHMLVIKGFLKDGRWITNDPGTRNGKDYLYPKQRLLDAIHDFEEGGVQNGKKEIIVTKP